MRGKTQPAQSRRQTQCRRLGSVVFTGPSKPNAQTKPNGPVALKEPRKTIKINVNIKRPSAHVQRTAAQRLKLWSACPSVCCHTTPTTLWCVREVPETTCKHRIYRLFKEQTTAWWKEGEGCWEGENIERAHAQNNTRQQNREYTSVVELGQRHRKARWLVLGAQNHPSPLLWWREPVVRWGAQRGRGGESGKHKVVVVVEAEIERPGRQAGGVWCVRSAQAV